MAPTRTVLFLLPYPLRRAPSQRFRVELFLPLLRQKGVGYRLHSFIDEATWDILYKKGSPLQKAWGVFTGFLRRAWTVFFVAPRYRYIFIHREAAPLGPPVFEWVLTRLLRKKIIYDFDDAIWIPNVSNENRFVSWFKAFWKVRHICRWSYKISAGNTFLEAFAREHTKGEVVLVPTGVDVEGAHNRLQDQSTAQVVAGWTGSHSTMKYLDGILPYLAAQNANIHFVVISNKPPEFTFPQLRFIPWSESTEIEDLLKLHIGLMPLEQDAWSEGKCGFKLIQYLALGIPALASPVGVNTAVIEHGVNGFLCETPEEWAHCLHKLANDENLRRRMGAAGREKIVRTYSIQANADTFLRLFS